MLRARDVVLQHLVAAGGVLAEGTNVRDGILDPRCQMGDIPFMEGRNDLTHHNDMLQILEGSHVFAFFAKLFGLQARTFDYKVSV